MRAVLQRRWAARDQRGLAVMTGLVFYVGASSLGLVALLTMSFTSTRIAVNQERGAQQLRAVDGAMATAVVELQRDPKGTRSAPTGDGGCVSPLGSDKDGALRVDDGMGDVVLVYASCWKGTEAGSTDVRLRAVLGDPESSAALAGTAWLSVRRSEDRQSVSVLDWNLRPDTEDPDPIPTTVPPTSVPPSTTTSTVPGAATWQLTVTSDWTAGYCADVVVTNPGSAALTWVVAVPVDGVPYSFWSGTWSQDGDRLNVKGEQWNHTLAAGASTNFGFCANR